MILVLLLSMAFKLYSGLAHPEADFDYTFIPQTAKVEMRITDKKWEKGVLKKDLLVVVSETYRRVVIFPFYKSSQGIEPLRFNLQTIWKGPEGFRGVLLDENNQKSGYVWIKTHKKISLEISVLSLEGDPQIKIFSKKVGSLQIRNMTPQDKSLLPRFP